jgi:hypothetical protein
MAPAAETDRSTANPMIGSIGVSSMSALIGATDRWVEHRPEHID